MTTRVALRLAYDGTGFHGFARQRDRRTVQGTIEERLSLILRAPVPTTGAGRTDAGVHAAGQVVSFEAPREAVPPSLAARLNKMLAPEIAITAAAAVPATFDARFSAVRREYRYRVYGGPAPDPFLDRFALWEREPLDAGAMDAAGRMLVGEHDFASFCRANERSLVRRIRSVRVRARAGGIVTIEVTGDSVCHQMVRSITGCLLLVGRGERETEWLRDVLAARDRSAAAAVAHPRGLTLERVVYRPDPFGPRGAGSGVSPGQRG